MNLFMDTSAFIALADASDQNHKRAKEFVLTLKPVDRFLTTNYCINESITRIRMSLGHKKACQFGDGVFNSNLHDIHYITHDIERMAWTFFKQHQDKEFSFTDCTSFVLMKELGISTAFTFDKHFEQIRFMILP